MLGHFLLFCCWFHLILLFALRFALYSGNQLCGRVFRSVVVDEQLSHNHL